MPVVRHSVQAEPVPRIRRQHRIDFDYLILARHNSHQVAGAGINVGIFRSHKSHRFTLFFGWLPLYLPEMFPTPLRATGTGVAYNSGRFLTAGGVLIAGKLIEAFHGDYAKVGEVTGLVTSGKHRRLVGRVLFIVLSVFRKRCGNGGKR